MRALVVYCHPLTTSFTAAIRDRVVARLREGGAEIRLHDLYAEAFSPVLTPEELQSYDAIPENRAPVERYVADLLWCDTLIFVYPTWWYGLPAMLKGWLDRVLLPGVAFEMPKGEQDNIRPALQNVTALGVFTTCGASWWLSRLIGAPGKRTLLRGLGLLIRPRAKKVFAAQYLMDSATAEQRQRHLKRVTKAVDRLTQTRS